MRLIMSGGHGNQSYKPLALHQTLASLKSTLILAPECRAGGVWG